MPSRGERWEVEFLEDQDEVEVERFISTGRIDGEASLADLWKLAE